MEHETGASTDPSLQAEAVPADDAAVEAVAMQRPVGTVAVAGIATFIVVAIFFAFYFFAYLPRGFIQ